ncbi:MAG: alpha/beta hydrolase [Crinalium sp.]
MKLFKVGYLGLTLLLSTAVLFLSAWIVIPAPTAWLLPLGVGASEISPILAVGNAIALLLSLPSSKRSWLSRVALFCSVLGLILSTIPLVQLPSTLTSLNNAMQATLGSGYMEKVPQELQAQMRPHPFILAEVFTGIADHQVRQTSGIRFAAPDGVPLSLEIYRPISLGKYPTIVTIYGGSWQRGTPLNDATFNRYMAARGYTVIAIDYRHAPQYRFPAQLEDVQTALTFIRNHAKEYEVDSERIALLGRSAGGHLAMLAAYQKDAAPIKAVVSYYSPVDLVRGYADPPFPNPIDTNAVLETFLGGSPKEFPLLYQQASPINYVKPGLPPTLLIYGGRDHLVQAKYGKSLYQSLRDVGNTVVFLEIPWAEHAFDAIYRGISNQLALYYTERFLAWALQNIT